MTNHSDDEWDDPLAAFGSESALEPDAPPRSTPADSTPIEAFATESAPDVSSAAALVVREPAALDVTPTPIAPVEPIPPTTALVPTRSATRAPVPAIRPVIAAALVGAALVAGAVGAFTIMSLRGRPLVSPSPSPSADAPVSRVERPTAAVPQPAPTTGADAAEPTSRALVPSERAPAPPSNSSGTPIGAARSGRANRTGTTGAGSANPPLHVDAAPLDPAPTVPLAETPLAIGALAPVTPPPAIAAESSRTADVEQIEDLLESYRRFNEELDASSAATLWRGVDTRTLARAFSTLSSQSLHFDRCDIAIVGGRATAACNGSLRFVRRVGDQTPRSRRMAWSFELERTGERWLLANVKGTEVEREP